MSGRDSSLLTQVLAALSRRTPAFRPLPDEPRTFADRIAALLARRKHRSRRSVALAREYAGRHSVSDRSPRDLSGVRLSGMNLSGIPLAAFKLVGAFLNDTNLTGADFSGVDLRAADLHGADLSRAKLAGANLTGANLTGAKLAGADLTAANLAGATMTGVTWDEQTSWPAALAEQLRSMSREVSPGVFIVDREGNAQSPSELV